MATTTPKTLREAIIYFSDYEHCRQAVEAIRWPDGVVKCPTCGSEKVTYLANQKRWKCYSKHPKAQFSLKVGTIFEDSPIGLEKWLPALWMVTACKNGISSYELARALGVTQKTAWFMLSRLRLALQSDTEKFSGHVEVDETFIGGTARFMHKAKRERVMKGHKAGQWNHKTAVVGAIKRTSADGPSQAVVRVIPNTRRKTVMPFVNEHVSRESAVLYTDALKSYDQPPVSPWTGQPVSEGYEHKVIDHAVAYVQGDIHTNSAENFWSLVKRMLRGTYVSVEPFHLYRYLDEQVFRFNNRKGTDAMRFALGLKGIINKRLTYSALTGSELPQTC
jgi:transposase-like protein